jgi:hypothetical protein
MEKVGTMGKFCRTDWKDWRSMWHTQKKKTPTNAQTRKRATGKREPKKSGFFNSHQRVGVLQRSMHGTFFDISCLRL